MTRLRLATFNAENLFSRARVLNLKSKEDSAALLVKIAELEALLARPAYAPADKARIRALAGELNFYIDITEDRGKLFAGRGDARRVVAAGRDAWDGGIVFRRASFKEQQRGQTARVITTVKADVQCLVEVEDRPALDAFNRQLLGAARLPFNMLIDGFDPRGIDVAMLSRHPITNLRTHIFDRDAKGRIFSRDCLEVELTLGGGRALHLLINHFKSQGYGAAADNDAKRLRQAKAVREIVRSRFDLAHDLVAVLGDFNAPPGHASVAPLLGLPGLNDVLARQFPNPADRWTYHYRRNEQIDFILASDALMALFTRAGAERRGMPDLAAHTVAGEVAFDGVGGSSTAASDHAAVWADFDV